MKKAFALVSMPWPLFNRPSVQLGVLKGYLRNVWPELEVRTFHPYVRVAERLGFQQYHVLSETSWLAESFFAALLFPQQKKEILSLFNRLKRKKSLAVDFETTLAVLENTLEEYFSALPWSEFLAVGFSVCLNQLCSSLWGARWLKKHFPELTIIFGGSSCADEMGKALLQCFPTIDYVINGEGERPLLGLLRHLTNREPLPSRGLFYRQNGQIQGKGFLELSASEIPSPIYEDYLKEVLSLPGEKRFFPLVPLEASRGCWWFKCRFCNLNLQWRGYRQKPLEKVLKEIRAHAQAGLLDFSFMDNCLPAQGALKLFSALAQDDLDYRFFAELRAVYQRKHYHLMRQGGLHWVQIGIEALSTSLLKRLNKGTTAIDNVAAMRHCEEAGLLLEGNLILEFPLSTREEMEESLLNLDFVFPFRPLTTVSFWLGYGSPVFRDYKSFGLKAIYPHSHYRILFPKEVFKGLVPLAWSYRGDRVFQRRLWRSVREKVLRWQKCYLALSKTKGPLLAYRDGGRFILIRQVLPQGKVLHHRLTGMGRKVYLFLTDIRNFSEIKNKFTSLKEDELKKFLYDMVQKRLIFQENNRYLALAIHRPNWQD